MFKRSVSSTGFKLHKNKSINWLQFHQIIKSTPHSFKTISFIQYQSYSSKNDQKSIDVVQSNPLHIPAPSSVKNPWLPQKDPNGSGMIYYWNPQTNETTPLGSSKPSHWVEIKDPNAPPGSPYALTYWWNVDTNETTTLGAPRPSLYPTATTTTTTTYYNKSNGYQSPFLGQRQPPQTLLGSMGSYFIIGVSMTMGILMVRLFIG